MNINATLFVQALSFAFLIWFSVKFIWPPLNRAIDERNKRIADGLAAAEKGKASLVEAQAKGESAMKEARERASGLLGDSEKRGAQIVEEAKAAAKEEADRIIAGAREQIASEVAKAKTELREQVAALAVAGAEKILQREIDAKSHAEMLGKLKAQL
ncbi:MAG TPA: F0F1 ATP synthase subunit B [Thermoleophilia bacterium]|jgi:F-type H+-transporting ATPase subunit b|nr:F0F1 ATP synthase subunit B [Thermoleophilia bacterium]